MKGWEEHIKYTNSVLYQKNFKQMEHKLMESFDCLYLDSVPESRRYSGLTVYTSKSIEKGKHIASYAGVYRLPLMGQENQYVFEVPNGFLIDASYCGNISRYINDPRGTRTPANCKALWYKTDDGLQIVHIYTKCAIQPGEEITMDYGPNYVFPTSDCIMPCRKCDNIGPYAPSRLKRRDWLCSPCSSKARYDGRKKDPLKTLSYKYYRRMHKKGQYTRMLTIAEVQDVLDKYDNQSVISKNKSKLCLYPNPNNSGQIVLVTSSEARSLSKCKNPMKRYPQLYKLK